MTYSFPPNEQPQHLFRFLLAIAVIIVLISVPGRLLYLTAVPEEDLSGSVPVINGSQMRLFIQEGGLPVAIVEEDSRLFVPLTIQVFNDLNLDGIQGAPGLEGNLIRVYNVKNFNDVLLVEEPTLTASDVRLCYELNCKSPDENGSIRFLIPKAVFESRLLLTLHIENRPGRYGYYTLNQPGTINGMLEGDSIILAPQFSGSDTISLPTNAIYTEFKIGFSHYPCVLPFAESDIADLLPMNFYDFDPLEGSVVNFDGGVPPQLKDIDPSFGNYHSDNHTGFDFYYPRHEEIVRWSCILPPTFMPEQSLQAFGNIVVGVSQSNKGGEFLISYGHLAAPSVEEFSAEGLRFGDAFGVIGDVGTSINHLHFGFGYLMPLRQEGGTQYCVTPLFPYLNELFQVTTVGYGRSQLGEELCFDNTRRTQLSFVQQGMEIYAPFIPVLSIGQ
jgi:hypothetical protein